MFMVPHMQTYEYLGKPKLARGFSYPVSRSVIDALIDSGSLTNVTGLAFVGPSKEARLLCGRYYGPKSRNQMPDLTLWINAVPSSIRHCLQNLLVPEGFAALSSWASQFKDSTLTFSQLNHTFVIQYNLVPQLASDVAPKYALTITQDQAPPRPAHGRRSSGTR